MARFGRVLIWALAGALAVAGCAPAPSESVSTSALPKMRWDHRPEAAIWTQATLAALQSHGQALETLEPSDIEYWCPRYSQATPSERRAFWAGLMSALAKHESTWRPEVEGGGGLWIGLLQIDPRTAKGHGCAARSRSALKNGAANLSCAVRIAANQVTRRGSVDRGMRDWGPFHHGDKRAEMATWTRQQPYCAG